MDFRGLPEEIGRGAWGLGRAREMARAVGGAEGRAQRDALARLMAAMFGEDTETRKRAADVARRITETSAELLWGHADELAGLLAEVDVEERRTRWHLGLVVARVAHTREQRLRAARLMEQLAVDEGNVVRCSAIEGIAKLACVEASLRGVAEEMLERAARSGTKAEQSRARHARRRLEGAGDSPG